jgi:hypothetical protein
MEKSFYFIDGVKPSKDSKRVSRRHVMKGKNVGKRIHRPSRQMNGTDTSSPSHHLNQDRHCPDEKTGPLSTIGRNLGDAILTQSLPAVGVTPRSLKIINECKKLAHWVVTNLTHSSSVFTSTAKRLYPVNLGFSLDEVKLMWVRILFTDNASELADTHLRAETLSNIVYLAYHCNVGLMQVCNEIFSGDGNGSVKVLHHLSRTLIRVQTRLASDDALSDSSIALVVSLISQEQISDQLDAAEIHAKGLEKMVQLRGGLGSLEGNVPLVLGICK